MNYILIKFTPTLSTTTDTDQNFILALIVGIEGAKEGFVKYDSTTATVPLTKTASEIKTILQSTAVDYVNNKYNN